MRNLLVAIFLFFICDAIFASTGFLPLKFTAKFEEVRKSKLKNKLKKSYGSIFYKYPGHIRLERRKPHRISIVRNDKKTWYYTAPRIQGAKGQLTVTNNGTEKSKLKIVPFLDLLTGDLDKNKSFKIVTSKGKKELVLTKEAQSEMGIKKGILGHKQDFKFENLTYIEIVTEEDRKIHFNLSEIQSKNIRFKPNTFTFEK